MPPQANQEQEVLPVFGPSLTGDGSPRCTEWTRAQQPCSRPASVPANRRHGPLCAQHAAKLREGRRS